MVSGHFWSCPEWFLCSFGPLAQYELCLLHSCGEQPIQRPEKGVNLEVYQVEHLQCHRS